MTNTTGISAPEPSPEAKAVHEQDADLRKWLVVKSGEREFRPFWSEQGYHKPTTDAEPPPPDDNGWGRPFDLHGILENVISEVDTNLSASTGYAAPPKPAQPSKSGGSTT